MNLALNYRRTNERLCEGVISAGHQPLEDVWDGSVFADRDIAAAMVEFKYIFKSWHKFLPFALKLRKRGIPVGTWNVDAPWNGGIQEWKFRLLRHLRLLTLYATHSLQGTDRIKHPRVIYLPNAAWTSRYNLRGRSLEDLKRPDIYRWDVSFVGNINSQRYPEHEKRVRFLDELGNSLRHAGLRFLWSDTEGLSFDEQVETIQSSRVNLSCISAADSLGSYSWGLPERCYGIPAAGGFLLMEHRVHLKDDFNVSDETATYDDLEDCIAKVLYYVRRHRECRAIAERAHLRVMRQHTYAHRAETLVAELQRLRRHTSVQEH